jgi:hypothetical protein
MEREEMPVAMIVSTVDADYFYAPYHQHFLEYDFDYFSVRR